MANSRNRVTDKIGLRLVKQGNHELTALREVALAARLVYHEMGNRISRIAFEEFTRATRDKLEKALANLNSIQGNK